MFQHIRQLSPVDTPLFHAPQFFQRDSQDMEYIWGIIVFSPSPKIYVFFYLNPPDTGFSRGSINVWVCLKIG